MIRSVTLHPCKISKAFLFVGLWCCRRSGRRHKTTRVAHIPYVCLHMDRILNYDRTRICESLLIASKLLLQTGIIKRKNLLGIYRYINIVILLIVKRNFLVKLAKRIRCKGSGNWGKHDNHDNVFRKLIF